MPCFIGDYLVDAALLQMSDHVPSELYRIKDYTSDQLLLRLTSGETFKKILATESMKSLSIEHIGVLLYLLMNMRAHLHAMNGGRMHSCALPCLCSYQS